MLDQVTGPVPADLARADGGECPSVLDETLILRIAAGNTLAMRALSARHRVRIFRFIHSLCGDAALANDLAAETFHDAWQQVGSYDGSCAVATWLLAMARVKTNAAMRQQTAASETPKTRPSRRRADIALRREDRVGVLRRCLAALSREDREILDLVYYHQQTIEAVAYILGVPVSAVIARMARARAALNKRLAAPALVRI